LRLPFVQGRLSTSSNAAAAVLKGGAGGGQAEKLLQPFSVEGIGKGEEQRMQQQAEGDPQKIA